MSTKEPLPLRLWRNKLFEFPNKRRIWTFGKPRSVQIRKKRYTFVQLYWKGNYLHFRQVEKLPYTFKVCSVYEYLEKHKKCSVTAMYCFHPIYVYIFFLFLSSNCNFFCCGWHNFYGKCFHLIAFITTCLPFPSRKLQCFLRKFGSCYATMVPFTLRARLHWNVWRHQMSIEIPLMPPIV